MELFQHQKDALKNMKNGCILNGGVGSGKSLTGLAYFFINICGGGLSPYKYPKKTIPLYIITTARKRDSFEWDSELLPFLLSRGENEIGINVVIDSWNNIEKYKDIKDSFFIFDEQRVVGKGAWVKGFLKISKHNKWILLSATPGDTWMDYIPVFIANGFFKNRTEFNEKHVIFDYYAGYPKVKTFINTWKLAQLRNQILISMDIERKTIPQNITIETQYQRGLYKSVVARRWDPFKNEPIENVSSLCYILRRVVNEDDTKVEALIDIYNEHKKIIVFYNFDYELELLKSIDFGEDCEVREWNGHKHQEIPKKPQDWVYLVQYTAGAEGWNCITTDTIVFYSPNYSYKIMKQAAGRIDRLNTPYVDLYYYYLWTTSPIDKAIKKAIDNKKTFNSSSSMYAKYF